MYCPHFGHFCGRFPKASHVSMYLSKLTITSIRRRNICSPLNANAVHEMNAGKTQPLDTDTDLCENTPSLDMSNA